MGWVMSGERWNWAAASADESEIGLSADCASAGAASEEAARQSAKPRTGLGVRDRTEQRWRRRDGEKKERCMRTPQGRKLPVAG